MVLQGSAKAFALRLLIVHYEQGRGHIPPLRVAVSSLQINQPTTVKQLTICVGLASGVSGPLPAFRVLRSCRFFYAILYGLGFIGRRRRSIGSCRINPGFRNSAPRRLGEAALSAAGEVKGHCSPGASSRRRLRSCNGSQMRKVVPRPTWLSSSMRPSWARTIRCTLINPSPEPFFFVV